MLYWCKSKVLFCSNTLIVMYDCHTQYKIKMLLKKFGYIYFSAPAPCNRPDPGKLELVFRIVTM